MTARIGTTGGAAGQFHGPAGAAIGPDGTLYVADEGNARVQEFDLFGRLLGGFGSYTGGGNPAAALRAPAALAVAPGATSGTTTVYAVDEDNKRVQVIVGDRIAGQRGNGSPGASGLGDPAAAVAHDGSLVVLDAARSRRVRYQGAGAEASTPLTPGMPGVPLGLAADGRGLVVAVVDPLRGTSKQQRLTVR